MRYSAEHRAETRQRILKEAAREIRARGPDAMGVSSVMARAKLTHGGFYAHFESKEDLVAEAVGAMFEDVRNRFDLDASRNDPKAALAAYVSFYLAPSHRDARERGCPLAALASDAPRLGRGARKRLGEGITRLTGWLADALARLGHADAEQAAQAFLAQLIGALSLARSMPDSAQSLAILEATRLDLMTRFDLGAVS